MFERSPQGIVNRRLFFGTDFLVYCEGIPNSRFPTPDSLFWDVVFRQCFPGKSVEVVSSGNRTEVLALRALAAVDKKVFFAVDSDMEAVWDRNADPGVVKSFGYSFEHDLVDIDLVIALVTDLPLGGDRRTAVEEVQREWNANRTAIRRVGLLNAARWHAEKKCFGKEDAAAFFDYASSKLQRTTFVSAVSAIPKRPAGAKHLPPRIFDYCCPGEVALKFLYHLVKRVIESRDLLKLFSYSSFVERLIVYYERQPSPQTLAYYQTQIGSHA